MTWLYAPLLAWYRRAGKTQRRLLKLILEPTRRLLSRLGDPGFRTTVRGNRLSLPASHLLPLTVVDHPRYHTLPGRVAEHVRNRHGSLVMVDVGANVGDTIVSCHRPGAQERFLAIDADRRYLRHLRRNTAGLEVTIVEAYCHATTDPGARVRIDHFDGTAEVTEDASGAPLARWALDDLLAQQPAFAHPNFLKIDTDGDDLAVVAGAMAVIAAARPVLVTECAPRDDPGYGDNVLGAVARLAVAGYRRMIAYDQYGNWFGAYDTSRPDGLGAALAYQVLAQIGYFDILFLTGDDASLEDSEREHFVTDVAARGGSPIDRLIGG